MEAKRNTIIFLHGGGVDHNWWQPQTESLEKDFSIYAPDLPGHGAKATEPFDMEQGLRDLETLFTDNGIDQALLVGISLGGFLAIRFSEIHPEKTSGLILSGSSANLNGFAGISFKLTGLFLEFKGPEWLNEVQLKSFEKRIPPEVLGLAIPNGLFLSGAISAFGKVAGKNYHNILQKYQGPVLILNGEQDEPNIAEQDKLLERLAHGSIKVLKNAGHLANLEQPEAYTSEVRRFALSTYAEAASA